jgi:hypothetical protein
LQPLYTALPHGNCPVAIKTLHQQIEAGPKEHGPTEWRLPYASLARSIHSRKKFKTSWNIWTFWIDSIHTILIFRSGFWLNEAHVLGFRPFGDQRRYCWDHGSSICDTWASFEGSSVVQDNADKYVIFPGSAESVLIKWFIQADILKNEYVVQSGI